MSDPIKSAVELLMADADQQMGLARQAIVQALTELGDPETAEKVRVMDDDQLEAFSDRFLTELSKHYTLHEPAGEP